MKICVPTEFENGMNSLVYGHFGSAPSFFVYDTDTKATHTINNSDSNHEHGQCNPIKPLLEMKIDAVVVSGMGARALSNLNFLGIKVYRISNAFTLNEFTNNWQQYLAEELTPETSCAHHNCG